MKISDADQVTVQLSSKYREAIAELHRTPAFGASGFDWQGLREGMGTRREPAVTGALTRWTDITGLPAEWVHLPGGRRDRRLLYLHGGGYVSGCSGAYLPLAAELARAADCAVLLPNYRLAPEDPHPAAVEDAVAAFGWLGDHGPAGDGPAATTFIAGDSAGGGLTLATLLALRDGLCGAADGVLPAAAITLSAYADLAHTGASLQSRAAADPIMSPLCLPVFAAAYLGGSDPRTPLASPLYADLTGLPPLLMQVGDCEIIRDDTVRVAARARAAGVDVTLEVWNDMFHVWQSHVPLLPEAMTAIEYIARFMQRFS